jgi:predicted permease
MISAPLDFLVRDIPRVVRRLVKAPIFSLVVVATLALAIGANGAVFTLIDQLLLRPLPVSEPDSLVVVNSPSVPRMGPSSVSGGRAPDGTVMRAMNYDLFCALSERVPVFERTLAYRPWRGAVLTADSPAEVFGEMVTGTYFDMLGIVPAVGRLLGPADDRPGAPPVVVLAHGYWKRQFGGDPAAVGRTIRVADFPMTVIGVAAGGFTGMFGVRSSDFFVPLEMNDVLMPRPAPYRLRDGGSHHLTMMARLRAGTKLEQAQAASDAVYQQLVADALGRAAFTEKDRQVVAGYRLKLFPGGTVASQQAAVSPQLLLALRLLMAMAVLLLVISATNVTNLILAREVQRRREVAIRFALGAGRTRMLGERLVESLVLAAAAGGASLIVAAWLADALLVMLPVGPEQTSVATTPDRRMMLFMAGVALAGGLLVWVASALPATRRSSLPHLGDTGDGGRRAGVLGLRRGLLALQAALSLVLLCGASVLAHSLYNLTSIDPGFRTDGLTAFKLQPASAAMTSGEFGRVVRDTLPGLRAIAGVQAAVATTELPLLGGGGGTWVAGGRISADAEKAVLTGQVSVTPGYFAVVGLPIIRGREFGEQDDGGAPRVAVVNESLAKALFGDEDPVGQMMGFQYRPLDTRIVGVVKDTRTGVRRPAEPTMYVAWSQQPAPWAMVVVRTPRDGALDLASVRQATARLNAGMPVTDFSTLNGKVAASLARDRMLAFLSSAIGGLGAFLCGLGLFGLMNYRVATRAREMGIRLALGAGTRSIQWLVIREALLVTLIGAPVGLAAYLASSRVVASILFELSPTDAGTLAAGVSVLALVTLAAAWVPARRAMRLDPAVTLRRE